MNSASEEPVAQKAAEPPGPPDSLLGVTGTESMPFGERLKKYRCFRKLSIGELARRAGLAKSYVSMLEAGKRQPGRQAAWRLGGALGMPGPDILLFLSYAHMSKEMARTINGKGISYHEYMGARVIDAAMGGATPLEKAFWCRNWTQKRSEGFTNPFPHLPDLPSQD